ncbi:hypothetical protein JMK10_14145 [Rhodovulum sulfidophilum]|uniref:hypothetical protein n=1 Tax=Rhodovulum sulfidophilum TaxID=35806 RepID=UPI001924AFA0|nr:hypothetical protein [Rhodovulum sulfidophilum]MBL3572837.1 hypothetical protein [Rhodovulum sulfidophilum]MCE8431126.1 hypothetical protein [Rhodovulum sulfidophilum]MCF4117927.1 hypothetical protein [Rhodovulum sulfidophilum]
MSVRPLLLLFCVALPTCTDPSEAIYLTGDAVPSWKFSATVPEAYRTTSLNIVGGKAFTVERDGLPGEPITASEASAKLGISRRVIAIHGTMYDPAGKGRANPHLTIYQVMRSKIAGRVRLTGIGWEAGGLGIESFRDAWAMGRMSVYGLAIENSTVVAERLSEVLARPERHFDFICHSIGCDIVRQLVRRGAAAPDHVLMLSPDTDYADMARWARDTNTPVLHVTASTDGVLRFSQFASRNRDFLPPQEVGPYRSILLEVDHIFPGRSRWSTDYVNPRRYLDHMATLETPRLWEMYLDFLDSPSSR